MVAMAKKAWFALMNWKTRMGSPRSPVRTRPLPLPRYRAPGAVAGSHAADGSVPRARRWSGRPSRHRKIVVRSRRDGRAESFGLVGRVPHDNSTAHHLDNTYLFSKT